MKKLYFDYNVINYLRQNTHAELTKKFNSIDGKVKVLFSPAHLEEIAVSAIRYKADKHIIKEEISFLKRIASNNSLRPVSRNEVVIYDEYPVDCYKRVVEQYSKNDLAEALEEEVILDANDNPAGSPKEMNNKKPDDILLHIKYREEVALALFYNEIILQEEMPSLLRWRFSDIKNRFYIFESYVNVAANILEKIGYYREKKDKSRSRLHDVSHIIYGAYSDCFVSSDRKLINKAKAIYSMLDVSTEVLNVDEFCNQKYT